MDLSKYYFLPGFTTNFEGEINFDKDNDIFGTDGINYTSNNNLELIKRNSLNYDVYEIDKLQGIYIKKEYFIDKGLQFIEFEDYHFFPFLNYKEKKLTDSNLNNIHQESNNSFFSVGFNTFGEIKYNIIPFDKWEKVDQFSSDYVPGTYIKKYPEHNYKNKGLVICVTEKNNYHKLVICLIQIIRYLGCHLPIELFYCNNELSLNTINIFNSNKGVKCVNLNDIVRNFNFSGYQIKPFSIYYSSFEEVVLIDADSILFKNPEEFFYDREYIDNGITFFIDQQNKKIHTNDTIKFINHNIDSLFNINYSYHHQEQCSSLVIINKRKKWLSLLGICGLNYEYKETYNHLFGDKDTFWLGCRLFNQIFSFRNNLGILTYPKKLKDYRKNYCEKHGGKRIIGNGDKIFLDEEGLPIHLNQFKMEHSNNDILHNSSWNFHIWEKLQIYQGNKLISEDDVDKNVFKIIMKYHNYYLKLCNPYIKTPITIVKYQKENRLLLIRKLLEDIKLEDFKKIMDKKNLDNYEILENSLIDNISVPENSENKQKEITEEKKQKVIASGEKQKVITEEKKQKVIASGEKQKIITEEKQKEIKQIKIIEENKKLREELIRVNKTNKILKKNIENHKFDTNIIKNNENRLHLEMDKMKEEIKKLNKSLLNYEKEKKLDKEKYGIEENKLTFKNSKLENKISDLQRENNELRNDIDKIIISQEKSYNNLKNENEYLKRKISELSVVDDVVIEENSDCNDYDKNLLIDDDILKMNLMFFESTNNIKNDFKKLILDMTNIQKEVITHINSGETDNLKDWNEIMRNISLFKNKEIKKNFIKDLNYSIKLLFSIINKYTNN